jgi:hypothetical protein
MDGFFVLLMHDPQIPEITGILGDKDTVFAAPGIDTKPVLNRLPKETTFA